MSDIDKLIESIVSSAKMDLATGIFGTSAVEDYAVSRWAYHNGLVRQYYWSAAQSIEKLGKLALLLQNKSVKKCGHDIVKIVRDLTNSDSETLLHKKFSSFDTTKRKSPNAARNSIEFIGQVMKFGSPETRYFGISLISYFDDIHRFDETFFRIAHLADANCHKEFQWRPSTLFSPRFSEEILRTVHYNNRQFGQVEEMSRATAMTSPVDVIRPKGEIGAKAHAWLSKLAKISN